MAGSSTGLCRSRIDRKQVERLETWVVRVGYLNAR